MIRTECTNCGSNNVKSSWRADSFDLRCFAGDFNPFNSTFCPGGAHNHFHCNSCGKKWTEKAY